MDNPWNLLYQLQWEHRQLSDKYDNMLNIVEKILEALASSERLKNNKKNKRRCKYFNRGFCRENETCPYFHPDIICQEFGVTGTCSQGRACEARHPHSCKYWRRGCCWRNDDCLYLHREEDLEKDKEDDPIDDKVESDIEESYNENEDIIEKLLVKVGK